MIYEDVLPPGLEVLLAEFRAGKRFALARAISLVENGRPGFEAFLHEIRGSLGRADRVGITGPPGAGKSTLTARLAQHYRESGERIGIVAVDPSSPFSGGALLGDRIRMNDLATDPGVFVRSMATRGSLGGLATSSLEVGDLLDAFGFDRVITETVGVGQSELEIAGAADSTVVVLVPESGDSIQAMKAGLMEIADLFLVNKADRPGADRLVQELELMLHMRRGDQTSTDPGHHGPVRVRSNATDEGGNPGGEPGWAVPVLRSVAPAGEGIAELADALTRHADHLRQSGELATRRQRRAVERVRQVVDRDIRRMVWDGGGNQLLEEVLPTLQSGEESPYSAAARIVRELGPGVTLPPGGQ